MNEEHADTVVTMELEIDGALFINSRVVFFYNEWAQWATASLSRKSMIKIQSTAGSSLHYVDFEE